MPTLIRLPDYADEHVRFEDCWIVESPPVEDYGFDYLPGAPVIFEDNSFELPADDTSSEES